MGDEEKKDTQLNLYALAALFCASASVGIVAVSRCILRMISDAGMCAIAVMGIGIAYFISKQPPRA
jgi:hypothetical protein